MSHAPDQGHDELRYRVFMAFAISTGAFSALMSVMEVFVRGPLAPQTLAFASVAVLFAGIVYAVRRTQRIAAATVISLGIYLVLFMGIESISPVPAMGIRVATFAFPVAATLLVSARVGIVFYVLASIQSFLFLDLDGDRTENALVVLHAVGAVFVGGILWTLAWTFDTARKRAMALANDREQQLTEALKRAEAAAETRARFLANMSHEIRTPMNGVLGLSRLLADEPLTPSQHELAETVVASGQSLLHILDDILDLSKLDAGALLIDPKDEQPEQIARRVVSLMRARAADGGLSLELHTDPSVPRWVHIDGHRYQQVLGNLVANAVKFTSEGGVLVRLSHDGRVLRTEVEDTGVGMAPAELAQIFRPFVQADSGTARRYGGSGLGLAISRRLCELMGGRIDVTSAPNAGSKFWFELPAPPADGHTERRAQDEAKLGQLEVLVAEDNRVNQMVVRRFLERLGVEATIVGDGAEAVEAVQRGNFDVVLMDRHMPGVDGLEATRKIRSLEGPASRIPVIALTASVMSQDRTACLEAGMNEVLAKPLELATLARTLRACVPRPGAEG